MEDEYYIDTEEEQLDISGKEFEPGEDLHRKRAPYQINKEQLAGSSPVPPLDSNGPTRMMFEDAVGQATPAANQLLTLKSKELIQILKDSLVELETEEGLYHAQILEKIIQNEELKAQLRKEEDLTRKLNLEKTKLSNDHTALQDTLRNGNEVRLTLTRSMATLGEDLGRLKLRIETLESKILHAKETAELKEDELEAWKIRATDANEECHLLQEKYNKSTIQLSKLRKTITEISKDTVNTNHKRLRAEDHGHTNVRKEIVTIDDSDVDDENDGSRDIGRSESSNCFSRICFKT